MLVSSCNQEKKTNKTSEKTTSTYYFIRHAEKDRSDPANENPDLTEKGIQRAEHWSEIFKNVKFDAVYSTNFNRTIETAKPTALKNNVEITIYDSNNIDISRFLEETKGKKVLVVGHSNSTPKFVNSILKEEKYENIDDSNNANLYVVIITGDIITDSLLLFE